MNLHNIGKTFAMGVSALAIIAILSAQSVKAASAPATQPSTRPTGSITVLVVDTSSKPVPGAMVRLIALHGRHHHAIALAQPDQGGQAAQVAHHKPLAIAQGTADDKGSFTFTDIPAGRYGVMGMMRKVGHGRARVELAIGAEGSASATVTITLTPPQHLHHGGPGGPTTQPANMPQDGGGA